MEFRIADTFNDSLGRLTGDEQKGDADAENDDVPVVGHHVDDVLRQVKVGHEDAADAEQGKENGCHQQGDESFVGQSADR